MLNPLLTTGIGSLPHTDADEACRLILKSFDIPFWPQLPRCSFREFMIPQYSEGMPFYKSDPEKGTEWVDKGSSDELERFYESWSEQTRIAISEDNARGLHGFLKVIKSRKFGYIKGHVTGPLTFTLGLKERDGKPVYFDEELREISLMLLQAKTRWQIDLLRQHADNVIIFVDEPILSALGSSSYLGVSAEEALRLLKGMTSAIKASGAVSGIHCCGNADWPLVMRSESGIISFDAYDYADTLALYPEDLTGFFERGGYLAWGIVPTSEAIAHEDPDSIRKCFHQGVEKLSQHIPESNILSRALLTPSCGTGSRSIEETVKIFQLVMRLKEDLS